MVILLDWLVSLRFSIISPEIPVWANICNIRKQYTLLCAMIVSLLSRLVKPHSLIILFYLTRLEVAVHKTPDLLYEPGENGIIKMY